MLALWMGQSVGRDYRRLEGRVIKQAYVYSAAERTREGLRSHNQREKAE